MLLCASCAIPLSVLACGGDADSTADHHDHGESIDTSSAPLVAADPVSTAVAQSCTTASVKGLATQLIEEIQCLRPNTFKSIENVQGLKLGGAVFPYLQTPAADALIAAQKARGSTMTINSAVRTLPQQYLLYRWYQTGRCGIGLAAKPGSSNHESAVALDIDDNAGWRTALTGKGFRWLGASDPVHYDFAGGGTVDLRGLSVKAFQRLWNRNHPEDLIAEDSAYGAETEKRLARAPVGGFLKGADCKEPPMTPNMPAPSDSDSPSTDPPPPVPDANEPSADDDDRSDTSSSPLRSRPATTEGCAVTPGAASSKPPSVPFAVAALGALIVATIRRQHRRSLRSSR